MAKIVSQQHDTSKVRVEIPDFDGDISKQLQRLQNGPWDAAEYGISREAAIARLKAADTPQKRAEAVRDLQQRALRRANLDTSNGKVAVMVAGTPPWHGLGVNVESAVNSTEAIKFAGLDWKVQLWKSYARNPNFLDAWKEAPDAMHVVRTDTEAVLGTVGTRYEPLQNKDAFEFMDSLVGEKLCMYETAGSINGGKTVWMLARIPGSYYAMPKDETVPYVLLTNSHDGSKALRVQPTTVRVVCQNTLNLSMKNGGSEKALHIRHTASLKGKVAEAKKALGLIGERLTKFGEQIEALARVSLKETQVTDYFEQFFPTRVNGGTVIELGEELSLLGQVQSSRTGLFAETERQANRNRGITEILLANFEGDSATGTAWGAYNAISEYADHQQTYKGKDKASARLNNAWFGSGNDLKQQAFSAAMAL